MTEFALAPEACTLPDAQRPLRVAEFETLFSQAVRSVERISPRHLRLALAGDASLEATVRDLAARESECCSFFNFTVAAGGPGRVRLDIEVPATQVEVVDALESLASAGES